MPILESPVVKYQLFMWGMMMKGLRPEIREPKETKKDK